MLVEAWSNNPGMKLFFTRENHCWEFISFLRRMFAGVHLRDWSLYPRWLDLWRRGWLWWRDRRAILHGDSLSCRAPPLCGRSSVCGHQPCLWWGQRSVHPPGPLLGGRRGVNTGFYGSGKLSNNAMFDWWGWAAINNVNAVQKMSFLFEEWAQWQQFNPH